MPCKHGNGPAALCSQCRAAPARQITRDPLTGGWLIDGKPFVREHEDGSNTRMIAYARKGGRAHARTIPDDGDDDAN